MSRQFGLIVSLFSLEFFIFYAIFHVRFCPSIGKKNLSVVIQFYELLRLIFFNKNNKNVDLFFQ